MELGFRMLQRLQIASETIKKRTFNFGWLEFLFVGGGVVKHFDDEMEEEVRLAPINPEKAVDFCKEFWSHPENIEKRMLTTESVPDNDEVLKITIRELEEALAKKKNGKAPEGDGINCELLEYAGGKFKERILRLCNSILWKVVLSEDWRTQFE